MRYPMVEFWKSKRVLVTGHTGFKGAWLSFLLSELGAQVHGLALDPLAGPNLFSELNLSSRLASDSRIDIREYYRVRDAIDESQPEVVFHLAAQALVGEGYRSPMPTLSTNVMGTANLLEATREVGASKVFLSITTDKVYLNDGGSRSFSEKDSLGGYDPYSASKAAADIISTMFSEAYLSKADVAVGVARAGNVIGGGDWSRDRLFPDLARSWSSHQPLQLRLAGATRPWQHVLEPLRGYLVFAEELLSNPKIAARLNFGPDPQDSLRVEEVVRIAGSCWPGNPGWVSDSQQLFAEAQDLTIDSSRAEKLLGVGPVWRSAKAIERTTHWYREYYAGTSPEKLCLDDISAFGAGR